MAGRAKAATGGSTKKTGTKAAVKTATKGAAKAKEAPVQEDYLITELDQYLFGQGTHYDIFRKLGAHPMVWKG